MEIKRVGAPPSKLRYLATEPWVDYRFATPDEAP